MLDNIIDNFWFGLQEKSVVTNEKPIEEKIFMDYLFKFQNGDFSAKREFVDFFLNASEWNTYVSGIRLFMAVCSHSDIELLSSFLSECDENHLRVFLAFVPESLTIQAVPYLLALYETWEDTDVGQDIAKTICEMLGEEYHDEVHYDVNELGNLFISFSEKNDLLLYYYDGKEYFVGEMTKKIISVAAYCHSKSIGFLCDIMSSVISNGTGVECPVHYNINISDDVMNELFEYVKSLIEKQQTPGKKYFFNHIINNGD